MSEEKSKEGRRREKEVSCLCNIHPVSTSRTMTVAVGHFYSQIRKSFALARAVSRVASPLNAYFASASRFLRGLQIYVLVPLLQYQFSCTTAMHVLLPCSIVLLLPLPQQHVDSSVACSTDDHSVRHHLLKAYSCPCTGSK